ncbi:thiamine pyrophosphate-binding protein [Corticibacterium sp. UT-5YL-CI-8]|nr:thiamine pyrophosphate-binding protein [Tianweitania sp. UT-5YL-CI-8]
MPKLAASSAIVSCLMQENVRFAFGIASGKLGPLMRALSEQSDIRFVGVRHEASAAHMAAGIFAGTGQVAVALGEIGPGGGNLVSGIASAFNNNLPLIAITSSNATHLIAPGRGMMMDMDLERMLAPITKFSLTVRDGRRIPEIMRMAFREALSGRPGPVHVSIPADILAGSFDMPDASLSPYRYRAASGPCPHVTDAQAAARLLLGAERPFVIAGGGAVIAGAGEVLSSLASFISAAATSTQMGIGAIPTTHSNFVGHGGVIGGPALHRALREADVVLSVGCRFSSWMWDEQGPMLDPTAKLIQIDTDSAAIGRLFPAEIGMLADARLAVEMIEQQICELSQPLPARKWTETLHQEWSDYRKDLTTEARPINGVMHPATLSGAIAEALPADALLTYDGGHTSFWSNDILPALAARTRFHEPGMAQLGFGTPYALALRLAYPDRMVVNVTGDGSFGFTMQELDTARRYGLNTITIIHNNEAWGVIQAGQKKAGFEFGTVLSGTDYAAIARGFGCHGETVTAPEQLASALERARQSNLPSVIDCRVAFVPHPSMPRFGAIGKGVVAA